MLRNAPSSLSSPLDRRKFLAGLTGASLMAIGCGADTYESRLRQTKDYFEYLEKVNLALGPKIVPFEGIEIRAPKPFERIVPPVPPADGEATSQSIDPNEDPERLGYHSNVRLEGVLASWRAKVDLEPSGEGMAYLHLMSNLPRWVEKQTNNDIEPLHYRRDLINVLANAYKVETETLPDAKWPWILIGSRDDDRHRAFSPYVGKKTVDYIDIPPDDQPINAVFYWMEVKDVHVGLVLIYPRAIDPRLKLEGRVKHTLETLKVPAQPPQKSANKPTVGGF
ncbi:MAG: hypothetical protein FD138_3730 [Planctomycetota bacterium]|nr:MAG: hypothetical protein FD138_3730 [Planctomycetota bacterium]